MIHTCSCRFCDVQQWKQPWLVTTYYHMTICFNLLLAFVSFFPPMYIGCLKTGYPKNCCGVSIDPMKKLPLKFRVNHPFYRLTQSYMLEILVTIYIYVFVSVYAYYILYVYTHTHLMIVPTRITLSHWVVPDGDPWDPTRHGTVHCRAALRDSLEHRHSRDVCRKNDG